MLQIKVVSLRPQVDLIKAIATPLTANKSLILAMAMAEQL